MYEETLDESAWSSSDEDGANENELPIDSHKYKILDHIDKYRVTCIQGETGSGKSTRVPQYIVQQYLQAESWGVDTLDVPNIIVTQPRRIAAKSLAKRVANELGEKDVGGKVGYKIGQDQKASENTMICFVTSGYFIELLVHNSENFNKFTHIILDEIHERNLDADLLSLMIKLLMNRHTKPKLIIMSATLHAELFLRYFCNQSMTELKEHLLFVGVKSPYQARTLYIEDVYEYCEENGLSLTLNAKKQLVKTYTTFSEVTYSQLRSGDHDGVDDLDAFYKIQELFQDCNITDKDNRKNPKKPPAKDITTIDRYIQTGVDIVQATAEPQGSILIFLPGIREIDEMYDLLMPHEDKIMNGWKCKLTIFPLHSKMPHEDQQECFRDPAIDCCHVLLATNIAESSITLPRVNVVIDFGQRRHVTYDPARRISYLKLNWCSQASMNQRKGRTGRVCDGVCFRIMTKEHFEKRAKFDEAQMRLAPLDKLILQVKYIGECIAPSESPSGLLSKAVEPPEHESILTAVKNLADIGALSAEDEEAEVTLLGKFCMDVPLDLTLCRLVFMGAMFKCPADALVMAAAIQCQDPFKQPSNKVMKNQEKFIRGQKNSFNSRRKYDKQSYSEPIMYRNVVQDWCERIDEEEFYVNQHELNNKGVKHKTRNYQQKNDNRDDLKHLRFRFGRENEIDAKRLKLLEGVISDVGFSLLKWLPKDSINRGNVQNLLNALPRNRKRYRSKYADDTESQKWKTVEEEVREEQELFCDDNFLLNMLLAAAFVPKFLYGVVGQTHKTVKNGKTLPDRMQKMKENMEKANVNPKRSICINGPPAFVMRSGNEEAVKYMIKCISLEVDFDDKREKKDNNRFNFNGKDQMFIEFNTVDRFETESPSNLDWKVTDDVHSSIASTFQYTEGAHGRDKTVIYELTRDIDFQLAINQEYKIKLSLPENPYRINFQLMSSNGTPLKNDINGKCCIASCNRWRNPVGFVCDTESRPHYGVVASMTGGDRGTLCWVDGMSLFPLYKCNLFAVCAMLAFLPQQHKAKFKISTKDMTIAQVELFNYEIPLTRQGKLTRTLLKTMNKMRVEVSEVFKSKDDKEAKKIPDCEIRDFFDKLMCEMEEGEIQSQKPFQQYGIYSKLKEFEEVDGFYMQPYEYLYPEKEVYLRPYNYRLLCDKEELYKYVKQRDKKKQRSIGNYDSDSD